MVYFWLVIMHKGLERTSVLVFIKNSIGNGELIDGNAMGTRHLCTYMNMSMKQSIDIKVAACK
jgi:hypothetical protein